MSEIKLALEERKYNNLEGTFFVDVGVQKERNDICAHNEAGELVGYVDYDFDYRVLSLSFIPDDGPEIDLDPENAEFYIKDLFDQVLEASSD